MAFLEETERQTESGLFYPWPTKGKMLAKYDSLKGTKVENIEPILNRVTGVPFHNTRKLNFDKFRGEPNNIAANLTRYTKRFSSKACENRVWVAASDGAL